jgi:hypothetical protein
MTLSRNLGHRATTTPRHGWALTRRRIIDHGRATTTACR